MKSACRFYRKFRSREFEKIATAGRGATIAALQKYRLDDVWETGKTLGRGSYATVVEVKYKGLICAAKKIYPILYEDGIGNLVSRFEQECKLLTNLRHPHIVQFVGIWFDSEMSHVPILVMEFLPTTLAECVERYGRQIPEEITYSIFRDVALGLRYLHERPNPIIHRDLSANNVLLTRDMRAKISDLGMAKILHLDPKKMLRMTKGPGTPSYMPPEATIHNPSYDTRVDIFSYGVMMVHVFSGEWPEPGENVVCSDTESLRAVSEAGRRRKYLDAIGHDHPLMELILKCLKNSPHRRPSIGDVFDEVSSAASMFPPTFTDRIEVLTRMKSVAAEVEEKQRMIGERDMRIQDLRAVVQEQEELCQAVIQSIIQEEEERRQADIQRVIQDQEARCQAEIQRAIEQEAHKHAEAKADIRWVTSQNLHLQADLEAAMERECAKDAEIKRLRENIQQAPHTVTLVAESTPLQLPLPPFSTNGIEKVVQTPAASECAPSVPTAPSEMNSSDAESTVSSTAKDATIPSCTPVPIMATRYAVTVRPPHSSEEPHPPHKSRIRSSSVGMAIGRPRPMSSSRNTKPQDVSHQVSATAENGSPTPVIATGYAVTSQLTHSLEEAHLPHMPFNRSGSFGMAFGRLRPMPTPTTKREDVSHQLPKNPITASPSPVEPKLQQRSEPLPQGGERSFVPTGALTGDPQLQALLEKQKNKVIEGEPGENYKLLEESQKFKQSCSAAPAVTSELQQKLNKRRC